MTNEILYDFFCKPKFLKSSVQLLAHLTSFSPLPSTPQLHVAKDTVLGRIPLESHFLHSALLKYSFVGLRILSFHNKNKCLFGQVSWPYIQHLAQNLVLRRY